MSDCVVVDVGGTTTDIGALAKGFPRQSSVAVEIGSVRTNFRMPDILSIGLGGGSVVRTENGQTTIGPDSVGFRLVEKGIGFGGDTLTATDVAVRAGRAEISHPSFDVTRLSGLSRETVAKVLEQVVAMTEAGIDKMKTSRHDLPVVLVGGGSIILPDKLRGASQVIRPLHYQYANAIGAAIAQVSGEVDRIWPLEKISRGAAVAEAKAEAIRMAIRAGADPETVSIVDLEDVPLAYLPSNALRIRAKAAGKLREEEPVVAAGD
jgi:N-methylhydantoinase A/oxoprolinase/acetone carboxylase beta subunit